MKTSIKHSFVVMAIAAVVLVSGCATSSGDQGQDRLQQIRDQADDAHRELDRQ